MGTTDLRPSIEDEDGAEIARENNTMYDLNLSSGTNCNAVLNQLVCLRAVFKPLTADEMPDALYHPLNPLAHMLYQTGTGPYVYKQPFSKGGRVPVLDLLELNAWVASDVVQSCFYELLTARDLTKPGAPVTKKKNNDPPNFDYVLYGSRCIMRNEGLREFILPKVISDDVVQTTVTC